MGKLQIVYRKWDSWMFLAQSEENDLSQRTEISSLMSSSLELSTHGNNSVSYTTLSAVLQFDCTLYMAIIEIETFL
jgi:hypothetical protein